jgi:hypothetical protein
MIVQNAAVCNKCGDTIISRHRHDYVQCSCGAIAVDGGQDYLRRVGGLHKEGEAPVYTDISWEIPDELYRACAQAVLDAENTNRNHFGIANAVMRKLREAGRVVADHEPRIFAENKALDEIMVEEADGTVNRYKRVVV